jgi:hypothetical protein
VSTLRYRVLELVSIIELLRANLTENVELLSERSWSTVDSYPPLFYAIPCFLLDVNLHNWPATVRDSLLRKNPSSSFESRYPVVRFFPLPAYTALDLRESNEYPDSPSATVSEM